ncbi:Coatomer subunit epsilon [Fasciola hepatica]|uniref:Coatomer subunit epsilon n=1 Tax=Fasciola hepatica TaxID=6192 RepID=A0A4E0RIA5_FASHE|nr:Coatomer subunit epsilon [Fasciola hepatica]
MDSVYLIQGGEQLQEALHIYEELREKHGPTSVILNGQAIALIGMNRWEEAETVLLEALDLDGNNPDIIVNMIVVAHHLNKPPETVSRLISQLKDSNKDHPFLVDQLAKAEEFTRCAQQYAPTVPD